MQQQIKRDGIAPRAIIVMGVSGSGKSTLGALLADKLRCRFLEGDTFHAPESIAKMRSGEPLGDEDRWPWLDRLGAAMAASLASEGLVVAACSALKRAYRQRLSRAVGAPVSFVLLKTDEAELLRRMSARRDHYMPASLLTSQVAALEEPTPDEPAITLDAGQSPEQLYRSAYAWLRSAASVGAPGSPA